MNIGTARDYKNVLSSSTCMYGIYFMDIHMNLSTLIFVNLNIHMHYGFSKKSVINGIFYFLKL